MWLRTPTRYPAAVERHGRKSRGVWSSGNFRNWPINDQFRAQYSEDQTQVQVKRHDKVSVITYPFNPLDAIGWHGDLAVVSELARYQTADVTSLPFATLCTHDLVGAGFVVCTCAAPDWERSRRIESAVLPQQWWLRRSAFHHAGDFFSRDNIEAGMVTFHPAGFIAAIQRKALRLGKRIRKSSPTKWLQMTIPASTAVFRWTR